MGSIGITDQNGKRKTYRVKGFDEVTIADWRLLTTPVLDTQDPAEVNAELISRQCSIPKSVLRKLPYVDMARLLDAMGSFVERMAEERTKADEALDITGFDFDGVRYTIPLDLEAQVTFGQWEDLTKVLLPKCQGDADMHAAICASLCLPEGEEYDGAKVMDRIKAFDRLPMSIALKVYAFFFDRSELFRNAVSRSLQTMTITHLRNAAQVSSDTPSDTVPSST